METILLIEMNRFSVERRIDSCPKRWIFLIYCDKNNFIYKEENNFFQKYEMTVI